MTTSLRLLFLGMIFLVHACTGQSPSAINNSSTPKRFVKESCSEMVFEGQVLRKTNILNVLDCSGWSKKYPDLRSAISKADEKAVDETFKVINDQFFSTKAQRKAFYEVVANAESRGELKTLATVLGRGLSDHKVLGQLNKALKNEQLSLTERSDFMKVLSPSNDENLKLLRALKSITVAYEANKPVINALFSADDKIKLVSKVSAIINDLALNLDNTSWKDLSGVLYTDTDSALKNWAVEGVDGDLRAILDIIQEPNFYKDASFLKRSIDNGVVCANRSSTRDFDINIGQELKHKIEGLKELDKDDFEKMLLNGLTKYIAFQEFCEEKEKQQGIQSFYMILKHAFNVLPSQHDFKFLKRIHQIFGEDRFVFLSFLSSKSFYSLRELLIDFKTQGKDSELVKSLYELLAELPDEDLKTISNLVGDLSVENSKTKIWHGSWSKLWKRQSPQEQNDLVSFLGVFLQEDIQASDAINFMETILISFPEFSPAFADTLMSDDYQTNLRKVVDSLSSEKAQQDLAGFFSNRGLFEFIEILTKEYEAPASAQPAIRTERAHTPYVSTLQSTESFQTRMCFVDLTKKYDKDTSYYNLVNTLPEACLNVLGDVGFVGQIYLWMNASNNYFKTKYQVTDFHAGTGVWAPGMLQFIFSAAVKADLVLVSKNNQKGLLNNITEIHKELTDPRLLSLVHEFSVFYGLVDTKLSLDQRFLTFVNERNDQRLNQMTQNTFKILEKTASVANYGIKATPCEKIDSQLGADPCLAKDKLIEDSLYLMKILRRENEAKDSLVRELVTWIHPQGGIMLPFGARRQTIQKSSIEDMVHFLYDLSGNSTKKPFNYLTATTSTAVEGSVLDRLEVVIRDIGFTNNFYGAYFKNEVASAGDYKGNVIESEKLLVLLDGASGIFRTLGDLPRESKYKLKNIRKTYSSLVELDNEYLQEDGSTRRYGGFIQSMLAAIAQSSRQKTQKFNAYRLPNERVVEGHNGVFLTKVVEMSGLRHLAALVHARLDGHMDLLKSSEFKSINENLIGRHDIKLVQDALQTVLDKYLDNDRNQLNTMVEDGVNLLYALDSEELKELEQIVLKGALLLSNKEVATKNIQKLAASMELVIEMWPEVRKILSKVENKKEIFKYINKFMDNLVAHPKELDGLLSEVLASDLLDAEDLKQLLNDPAFRTRAVGLLNQLIEMNSIPTNLNWIDAVKAIFSSDMQWESLKTWFQVALGEDQHKLTVSLLVKFLGDKNGENYRFKEIMDELFLNHRKELDQFLRESFKAMELEPEQTSP